MALRAGAAPDDALELFARPATCAPIGEITDSPSGRGGPQHGEKVLA
jgi:hypothetical protein